MGTADLTIQFIQRRGFSHVSMRLGYRQPHRRASAVIPHSKRRSETGKTDVSSFFSIRVAEKLHEQSRNHH